VTPSTVAPGAITLADGTLVEIATDTLVTSATAQRQDRFPIRLTQPITVDGRVAVPAGTMGEGQVVHAEKARGGGRAGELILAARFLTVGDQRVALRGFRFGAMTGEGQGAAAMVALVVAGPLTFLVRGGNIEVPAGTLATARVAGATTLNAAPPATPDPAQQPPAQQPPTGR
jgi:hypothetical protein